MAHFIVFLALTKVSHHGKPLILNSENDFCLLLIIICLLHLLINESIYLHTAVGC